MLHMEVCLYNYFWWYGYSGGSWGRFVTTDECSVRVTKITVKNNVSWIHSLPFWFISLLWINVMVILSKAGKTDDLESHNSLKLSLTNNVSVFLSWYFCFSFALKDSVDYSHYSVSSYLPLFRKDFFNHMHGLVVYVKEGLRFAQDVLLQNSQNSNICFR